MLKSFLSARNGNVAMMFGLLLVPLLIGGGVAIDLARRQSAQGEVSAALEAALLYVARHPDLKNDVERSAAALKFFNNEVKLPELKLHSLTVNESNGAYTGAIDADIKTSLMSLGGYKTLSLDTQAKVVLSENSIEIALALDVTGSMAGTKIVELRQAATALVNYLDSKFADKSRLKISLVPFATYVNVDAANASQSWIDAHGKSPANDDAFSVSGVSRIDLLKHLGKPWSGCVEARPIPYDVTDEPANAGKPETLFLPLFHPDEPDDSYSYANTYLADAGGATLMETIKNAGKYGVVSATPAGAWGGFALTPNYRYFSDTNTPIGPAFNCADRKVLPLTSDRAAVLQAIAALSPEGSTNITEGLMWGWRTLSSGAPFTEGAPKSKKNLNKIVILLTDGNNHVNIRNDERGSEYFAYGYLGGGRLGVAAGASQTAIKGAMDKRTEEACKNAKADGLTIYTIRLDLANDLRSENLLKACATTPERHYLDVPNAADLERTFKQIADEIIQLYISE